MMYVFFLPEPYCGLSQESDLPKHLNFSVDSIGRDFGCRDQKMDSSSALESYGSLLSNAPSLATIVWLLAMLQHESPATMICKKKHTLFSHHKKSKLYLWTHVACPRGRSRSIVHINTYLQRFPGFSWKSMLFYYWISYYNENISKMQIKFSRGTN